MLLLLTFFITSLVAEYTFPELPSAFKTRIFGVYHSDDVNVSYTIEQNYVNRRGNDSGSTFFTSKDTLRGMILDSKLWQSIDYNTENCTINPLPPYYNNDLYQPFNFFKPNEILKTPALATFIDIFKFFQSAEVKLAIVDTEGEDVVFSYNDDNDVIGYNVSVHVSKELESIVKVVFKKNNTVINTMHYGEVIKISNETDLPPFLEPPNDVFCKSNVKDRNMPYIDSSGFYSMDVVISSEFSAVFDFPVKVKISEYKHENLISIGYQTPFINTIEQMNLVHNYDTGIYANISMDEGNCTLYKLKFKNPNGTIEQKKTAFKEGVIRRMNFIDKIYLLELWQIIQDLDQAFPWQYQGVKTIDSTLCNVWSCPFGKSYVAEVAFSYHRRPLRQHGSRITRAVPIAIQLFRKDTSPYQKAVVTYRIFNYQVDDNPVRTEVLYDTSVCYLNNYDTTVVQFLLDIPYAVAVEFGVRNVARAVIKSLMEKVKIESHQVHHISITSAPNKKSRVTFTIYKSIEKTPPTSHFKQVLEKQINKKMKLVFSNIDGTKVQIALTVPGSLVFDYKPSSNSNHWSVSIAATISMCIGTMFVGIVIGVVSINCWKNKRSKVLKTDDSFPNYRRFNNEDIEEVDIGV